ncbi:sugar transferase [Polynucleobacter asymbioticus]|jgi:lipopolysaccharide/colanic/teichoic acid biosynthesis glycosyltransferase|uniref:sugar transferase n=1 Tax=Polynucleobacter asymbioticus TaxID=576611 RepID=UPI0008F801C8|nr:sugar transferase [Polynucleobacter asymbioticus]
MYRSLDLLCAIFGLILGFPFFLLIYILGFFDTGSPIFYQVRVGKNQKSFVLIKFRTMCLDTVSQASHLTNERAITRLGSLLRKTKLDELPQLWNVLKGDMSIVGPRPCLYAQVELIEEREILGVYKARPGITGLAQINNIDMSTPKLLAETDARMLKNLTLYSYIKYIFLTVCGDGSGDAVKK